MTRVRRRLGPSPYLPSVDRLDVTRVIVREWNLAGMRILAWLNHRNHGSFRRLCCTIGNSPPTGFAEATYEVVPTVKVRKSPQSVGAQTDG